MPERNELKDGQKAKCTKCGAVVTKDKLSVEMYHDLRDDPEIYDMCGPCEPIRSDEE